MLNRLTASHGSNLGDPGRLIAHVTAIFMLGAGFIHLSAASDHKALPLMMVGFLIVALLQIAVGGLLLAGRPRRLLLWGAVALTVSSLGLWFVSRTAGLPFLPGGHMEPIGFKDGVTVVFQLASLPGLFLLMTRHLAGVVLPAAFGSQALSVMGVGATLLMVPALMLEGGMHHSQEQMEAAGHGGEGDHHGEEAQAPGDGGHSSHGGGGAAGGDGAAGSKPHSDHASGAHGDDASAHRTAEGQGAAEGQGHDAHGSAARVGPTLARVGHADHGGAGAGSGAGASDDGHASHSGDSGSSRSGSTNSRSGGSDRSRDEAAPGGHEGHDDGAKDPGAADPHAGHDDGAKGSGNHETHAAGHSHVDGCDPSYRQQFELLSVLGMRFIYQPGADGRNSAFRMCGPAPEDDITHEQAPGHCDGGGPTAEQQAFGDRLISETRRALAKYKNNWQLALEDGYKPFPIVEGRWVHMTNQERYADDTLIDPDRIDSFMFARVGNDWIPVGGMYMYGDRSDPNPPNPTGCLLMWHRHASYEGYGATAAYTWDDAWVSEKTMWMAHVWTYGDLDPWGRDFDGTEPASWSWPSSMLPVGCDRKNFCPTP